ncbi:MULTISPECIES: restriction endonuclease subunit S [Rhodococcus erythropolis group]|uniref:Restriction endonuclease subunit S n=1 Tax=Rhodococcus erythropolis TaxID=1833 RepID=A0A8I0ZZG3_RHOER|nr:MULTISPECIES: restriction endonuclease subunit S [Rhodococcus erythropolis group]MBH5144296.1 restriction endonuclease subunit S [Rhodococcus erythropolis]MDJ0434752.1 restriction endonuclease subunit S [Rhodococcus qingshengii]QEM25769.1 restriction endonuclease subunit S [Rhodococcus qingshengii]
MTADAPWLPELPNHWEVVQMRRCVTFRNGADYKDVEVYEGGFPVYGSGGEFRRARGYLYDGPSVLFGRKGTIDRPLLVSGKFWTVDTMFYTELGDRIEPRFLHYYATTMPFSYYSTSTALPSMTQGSLGGHRMPLAPLEEQHIIADYLDRETARIDVLVEEQRGLIEMLRERRQDLVRAAVLGSANPFSPPPEAAFTAIGHHFSVTLGKMLDAGKAVRSEDRMLPYIRAGNIQDAGLKLDDVKQMPYSEAEASNLNLLKGDLLVVEGGAVGTNVLLHEDMPEWSFQKTVNRLRPLSNWSPAWLGYVLRTYRDIGVIDIVCNRSTISHLTAEKLRAMRVPNVDPLEQERVAATLDRQTAKIDVLIAESERFVALSCERRAALITAAVTGQIDVRELA